MKILLTAIALTIAAPALAQTAAPADAHAHAGHPGPAASAQANPSTESHAGHDMSGMMDAEAMRAHCEKMKAEGMKMDGCDMHAGSKAEADPHAGHKMSPQ